MYDVKLAICNLVLKPDAGKQASPIQGKEDAQIHSVHRAPFNHMHVEPFQMYQGA